ncbi:MAG: oligosaccharide flippase family protein [Bryobacterales bacterium]|nr:oligosaccharide flippase family protein [Bryobacterales bacterium]
MQFSRLLELRKSPVVRNALLLYGVQISSFLLPLITLPYLARVLSPAHLGLITFSQAFIWYFQTLTEYGFNLTATRRIAIARDQPEEVASIFRSTFGAKLLLTIAGFIILVLCVFLTPRLRPNWPLFFISFLGVVANLLFPVWLYQGLEKLQYVAYRDLTAKLVSLGALFILVRDDSDYLLAAAVPNAGLLAAGFIGLIQVPAFVRQPFRIPAWSAVAEALKSSWSVFVSMAAMSLTSSTNMFLMGLTSAAEEVAFFGGAQRIIVALRMLVTPMTNVIYPHISHKASISRVAAVEFLNRYALLLSVPFLLMSLVVLGTAPYLVELVLGPQYPATTPLLRIMAFSPFLLSLSHSYATYYMLAFGYEKQWSRIILVSSISNFVILIPLLVWMRPSVAVAITWIALDVLTTALFLGFSRRSMRRERG